MLDLKDVTIGETLVFTPRRKQQPIAGVDPKNPVTWTTVMEEKCTYLGVHPTQEGFTMVKVSYKGLMHYTFCHFLRKS